MPRPITIVSNETVGVCNNYCDCCPHSRMGINISGAMNVFINNKMVHRVGDIGLCRCPHGGTYTSITGSKKLYINMRPVTRIGDTTICVNCGMEGYHVTGSKNVFIDWI